MRLEQPNPNSMEDHMLLRTIATRLLHGHISRRLTRFIPHPGLRLALTLASSILVPIVVERVMSRKSSQRKWRLPFAGRAVA